MKPSIYTRIRIYTDGACSKNPGPGGWAAIVCLDKDIVELQGGACETTNNRMELTAVVEALSYVMKNFRGNRAVAFEILSDSAYVINAINNSWLIKWRLNNWKTSKGDVVKNKDLWCELLTLLGAIKAAEMRVTFIHVRGHAGNFFNERADALAKSQAAEAKYGDLETASNGHAPQF